MKEILQKNGFYMFKSCNCGGKYNEQYRHMHNANIKLKIYPNHGTYEIGGKTGGANNFYTDFYEFLEKNKIKANR